MTDRYAADYGSKPLHASSMGNAWAENYSAATAALENEKIYLGIIPAGVEVDFVRFKWADCGTGCTVDLGYEPIDGSLPEAVGDYWVDGQDVATAAGIAISSADPIRFERPVKLVATVLDAAFTNAPALLVNVKGVMVGAK